VVFAKFLLKNGAINGCTNKKTHCLRKTIGFIN